MEILNKIYKFEKQIFIVQCQLEGSLDQGHDIVDEIQERDDKSSGKRSVNLDDPQARLKKYMNY